MINWDILVFNFLFLSINLVFCQKSKLCLSSLCNSYHLFIIYIIVRWTCGFVLITQWRILLELDSLALRNDDIIMHIYDDKGFTVAWIDNIFHSIYHIKVPRTTVLPSLHGGSLKMALTVPLNWRMPLHEFLFKTKC